MTEQTTVDTSAAAIAAVMESVTKGPWVAESGHEQRNGQLYWQVTDGADAIMQNQFCWCQGDQAANARFIAAARDLVPALSAQLTAETARADAAEAERDPLRASEATAIDRVKRLTDFISEFAEYKFDVLGSAYHVSPEDETDDYTDLGPVLTWQEDAVSILATTKG